MKSYSLKGAVKQFTCIIRQLHVERKETVFIKEKGKLKGNKLNLDINWVLLVRKS